MDLSILSQVDDSNTKDCFLDALFILLKKKPFKDITVVELCKQANFSRKTFYDNFTKKEDLIDYLANDLVLGFHITDDESGFLHFFEFWYELRDWVKVLIENDLWTRVVTLGFSLSAPLVKERDWNFRLEQYSDQKIASFEFVNAGCVQLLYLWYLNDFKDSPANLAGLVKQILSGRYID